MTDTQSKMVKNAAMFDDIDRAGLTYRVRKYAGAWVPVVVMPGGKTITGPHCQTSGGAMDSAISKAAKIAREQA